MFCDTGKGAGEQTGGEGCVVGQGLVFELFDCLSSHCFCVSLAVVVEVSGVMLSGVERRMKDERKKKRGVGRRGKLRVESGVRDKNRKKKKEVKKIKFWLSFYAFFISLSLSLFLFDPSLCMYSFT